MIEDTAMISNERMCPCCGQAVEDGALLMDDDGCTIGSDRATIRLTRQQYRLARALIQKYPGTASKDFIYDSVFMDAAGGGPNMKIMDVLICRIRPMLAELGYAIETVWGAGYRLVEGDPKDAVALRDAAMTSLRGRAPRWAPSDDATLRDLIARKMKPAQCAAIMKRPYMTVERHYRRLASAMEAGE